MKRGTVLSLLIGNVRRGGGGGWRGNALCLGPGISRLSLCSVLSLRPWSFEGQSKVGDGSHRLRRAIELTGGQEPPTTTSTDPCLGRPRASRPTLFPLPLLPRRRDGTATTVHSHVCHHGFLLWSDGLLACVLVWASPVSVFLRNSLDSYLRLVRSEAPQSPGPPTDPAVSCLHTWVIGDGEEHGLHLPMIPRPPISQRLSRARPLVNKSRNQADHAV